MSVQTSAIFMMAVDFLDTSFSNSADMINLDIRTLLFRFCGKQEGDRPRSFTSFNSPSGTSKVSIHLGVSHMTRYYAQTVDIGYSIVIEFPFISVKLIDMLKSMLVLRQAV